VIGHRPDVERILCSGFGLTQAEARVALAITKGERLDEIARARGVTVATARTQLKSVFSKTRTHRQAELVAFVGRIKNRDARYKARGP
jgi:DNA-binding CsgD family transcriptional regulator